MCVCVCSPLDMIIDQLGGPVCMCVFSWVVQCVCVCVQSTGHDN